MLKDQYFGKDFLQSFQITVLSVLSSYEVGRTFCTADSAKHLLLPYRADQIRFCGMIIDNKVCITVQFVNEYVKGECILCAFLEEKKWTKVA